MGGMCTGSKKKPDHNVEPRKLHEKEVQLLMDNTNYNRDEIIEWHTGFIKDNPHGKMNKKEFIQAYKKFYPQGKPDSFCEHCFRVFDADSNGFIDFKEFLVSISITSTSRNLKKKLRWIFTMYDIDGNGTIDRNEFRTILTSMLKILDTTGKSTKNVKERDAYIDALFTRIDRDKSNLISLEEFIDSCTRDKLLLELLAPSA